MSDEQKTQLIRYEAARPVETSSTLRALISRPDIMQGLTEIIPKHLEPERLAKIALLAASRQPLLLKCTQGSILKAIMTSAELGVSCSGSLARGYLVPRWNKHVNGYEAQFTIGYGGLIDIICEPGSAVTHITPHLVYEDDFFEIHGGSRNEIVHTINPRARRHKETLIGGYMVAWIRDSSQPFFWFMTKDEIEEHMNRTSSRNKQGEIVGPWVTDYLAMCRKTPVRAGAQYLPLSKGQQDKISRSDEDVEYDTPPAARGATNLKPTNGREGWGFDDVAPMPDDEGNQDPPIDVTPDAEPEPQTAGPPETKEEPVKPEPPKDSKVVAGLKKLFAERGKLYGWDNSAKKEASEEALKAAGISSWSEITLPEHEIKMQEWLDACFPAEKEG